MHATVVTCAHCAKPMAVVVKSDDLAEPHPYVFGCPWCGRLTQQTLRGVLSRVMRATVSPNAR